MEFLAPLFLLGLASIALPLWLHRRERQTSTRQVVSSLLYFEPGTRSGGAPRQLRDLLLLALRLVLLALACLAFAQPVWKGASFPVGPAAESLQILVLDSSLSMSGGERSARARAQAGEILDALAPRDWAELVRADGHTSVLAGPTRDPAPLRAALATAEPSVLSLSYARLMGELPALVERARERIARQGGRLQQVDVHLISDFQRSEAPQRWIDRLPRTAVTLALHPVAGAGEEPNWFFEQARAIALAPGRQRIEAVVRGIATPDAEKTLRLEVGGLPVASAKRSVPADGRASFALEVSDLASGYTPAELVIEGGDSLAADDRQRLVMVQRPPAPVLFVSGDPRQRDAVYFRSALAASALAEVELDVRSAKEIAAQPLAQRLVVLSDVSLPAAAADRLRDYVAGGGAVWLILGERSARSRSVELTGHRLREPAPARDPAAPLGVALTAEGGPELGRAEAWRDVHLYRLASLVPEPGDSVLLRASDGSPLLLEQRRGEGRVWILASALDPAWSDLPLEPVFVPFVRGAAAELAGLRAEPQALRAGETLVLPRGPLAGPASPVQVLDPGGARMFSLEQTRSARSLPLERLGFFTVQQAGAERPVAVNADPAESDLRAMEPAELDRWREAAVEESRPVAAPAGADGPGDERTPLGGRLIWLLVIALLFEPIVARRALRARAQETP